MGHAKELITVDVYGDNQNIIREEIPELLSYMEDAMPKGKGGDKQEDEVLDAYILCKMPVKYIIYNCYLFNERILQNVCLEFPRNES